MTTLEPTPSKIYFAGTVVYKKAADIRKRGNHAVNYVDVQCGNHIENRCVQQIQLATQEQETAAA
ncbi:hypothetical protein AVDCRST_MAG94-4979 [uncultured Leptolyngbya sp.]|uniref:Uncharacterized protein n=1 Tax=uncultured Leptolyngbya sp. TaxID=332963 RepID=A0A6J4NBD2_9CYAN|nr:hypothetical protein AVDCRST_MAG94-4979 [uncultured Leptolyngbya sp.]